MMVLGSAFGINADAAKTFPEICGEKQEKIQEKISRKREKFYWFSAVFMEKTAKKGTFFEVFSRNFNGDKSSNQAHFFFHES